MALDGVVKPLEAIWTFIGPVADLKGGCGRGRRAGGGVTHEHGQVTSVMNAAHRRKRA